MLCKYLYILKPVPIRKKGTGKCFFIIFSYSFYE